MQNRYLLIDFDSTFVQIEALDELATIALADVPNREMIVSQIKAITNRGMDGEITFQESLIRRLSLFKISHLHISQLVTLLLSSITPSFIENKSFIQNNAEKIYIISGGFKEYILPIVSTFNIPSDHVMANTFLFQDDYVTGFDTDNLLSQENGKAKQVAALNFKGEVIVLGDGFTDYQIRAQGLADKFFAFTENVSRDTVINKADSVISNFGDAIDYVARPDVCK